MNNKSFYLFIVIALVVFVLANSLYIVEEREKAVLLKFGKVVDDDIHPGLHVKIPFVDVVKIFDARIQTSQTQPQRFLTVEKKAMMVDYFVKWRIFDVGKYYTATNGDERRADQAISRPVNEGLRNEFGERTLQDVVSGERDELMSTLIQRVSEEAQSRLGVEIIDVRVKRIDLPEDVSSSVYSRMRAERNQEATDHRAKGEEQKAVIIADADRQVKVIEADAYRQSEIIRGEGDAQAAAIYASAYQKDPEFYSFVRSLTAYTNSFSDRGDLLLVDPKSDFFKYLNNQDGK